MDKFFLKDFLDGTLKGLSLIQSLTLPEVNKAEIYIDVLRLDTIHHVVSGNKWFKLRGHLQVARLLKPSALLTFGGAWSNHIEATAFAAQQMGISSVGIIRGEHSPKLSATLLSALGYGMQLEFISRNDYMQKDSQTYLAALADRFQNSYIIPEGGGGAPGISGIKEIARLADYTTYSHIICAVGTGTMLLGLRAAAVAGQEIIGVPVLKGLTELQSLAGFGSQEIDQLVICRLDSRWHWGGYARWSQKLLNFMNRFHRETGIPTDFVYTGKLFYALLEMIREDQFPAGSRILVIHSGGLQGNRSLLPGSLNF